MCVRERGGLSFLNHLLDIQSWSPSSFEGYYGEFNHTNCLFLLLRQAFSVSKEQLDMAIVGKLSVLLSSDSQAGSTNGTQHERKPSTHILFTPQQEKYLQLGYLPPNSKTLEHIT